MLNTGDDTGNGQVGEPVDALEPMLDGRRFVGERKVRLGDVDRHGRLRLDALTRYTQDVSDDDTTDAGLGLEPGWVVRSTVVDQLMPAGLGERLKFVTFCSGLGKRWAERRLSITGSGGRCYEVATLWVCIDSATGRPTPLTDQFIDRYGPAAGGRTVSARLRNPKLDEEPSAGIDGRNWHLRSTDFDVYGHVNNAAYWTAVEHLLDPVLAAQPLRARLEYGSGLPPVETVPLLRAAAPASLRLWWLQPSEAPWDLHHLQDRSSSADVAASAAVGPLDPAIYER